MLVKLLSCSPPDFASALSENTGELHLLLILLFDTIQKRTFHERLVTCTQGVAHFLSRLQELHSCCGSYCAASILA